MLHNFEGIFQIPQIVIDGLEQRVPDGSTVLVAAEMGSGSHGTTLDPSEPAASDDTDIMVIVVPPIEYVFGLESWEGCDFWIGSYDIVVYSVEKFFRLLMKGNPNVLGLLWLEDYLYRSTAWSKFIEPNKRLFSTLQAYHAFAGYASGQIQRMTAYTPEIAAEYDAAAALVEAAGWAREAVVQGKSLPMPDYEKLRDYMHADDFLKAAIDDKLAEARKTITHIHAKYHYAYMGERRRQLVKQFGMDVKNASHAIRLMRMCIEFLFEGELRVKRIKDAEYLKSIKRGEVPLEAIQAEAAALFEMAKFAKSLSTLPESPDRAKVNEILAGIYWSMLDFRNVPTPR